MDESKLIEKLLRIEALHAGATTEGERLAAAAARERILDRLRSFERVDPPVEFKFSVSDPWSRRVLVARPSWARGGLRAGGRSGPDGACGPAVPAFAQRRSRITTARSGRDSGA